ncbi:tetratricopeptide repeat protein [Marinilabilia rubra]|uniref:Tetratricopeptide repeat protein n=1 Tax=Marinilabilia rubra TaxID=2162893 RepID=A0A2U2B7W3_9BACT|nr:hypothetical protein [Marinilabilia rubra]PWD99133.1 hypothetical protein DDZ16_11055 [Marinilabilia rubra]
MHSLTNKSYLICIFLSATFLTNVKAAEISDLWHKADSLYKVRDYIGSIVEYERIVFLSKNIGTTQKAIFKKAEVYKHIGNYPKVEEELMRIGIRDPKDSLFATKAYELAFAQYMKENYRDAENTIETYSALLETSHPKLKSLYTLKALCHNQLFEFKEAKECLTKSFREVASEKSKYLNILAFYKDTPKYKDPEKARHLSILPGLGQAYCGKIFEGGISFLLNASALSFGAWQVYTEYYFTGYVVGVTLLQKFHSGGQHRAETLAKERNRKEIIRFNTKITSELIEGPCP